MYRSPIELTTFTEGYRQRMDEETGALIIEACTKVGVDIDKEELIKMANYDRGQYQKGYEDGQISGAVTTLKHLLASIDDHISKLTMADTQSQEVYMMGERHIRDIVELYLSKFKEEGQDDNSMDGDSF